MMIKVAFRYILVILAPQWVLNSMHMFHRALLSCPSTGLHSCLIFTCTCIYIRAIACAALMINHSHCFLQLDYATGLIGLIVFQPAMLPFVGLPCLPMYNRCTALSTSLMVACLLVYSLYVCILCTK